MRNALPRALRWMSLAAVLPLALPCPTARGQSPNSVAAPSSDLAATVRALDKQLFDAYNACDLQTLGRLVSEDLEFYHDKTGLATGRATFLQAIQNNICGKVHRTLIPGSLEVYPLEHYGAVEMGAHTFTHPGLDADQGDARFVMLWRNANGSWQLTRVISYDHGSKQH